MSKLESLAIDRDSRVIENNVYISVLYLSRTGKESPV